MGLLLRLLLHLGGVGSVRVTDNLIGADKKISNCLIKITFLMRVETAVRLCI